jgi:hypothetical protein
MKTQHVRSFKAGQGKSIIEEIEVFGEEQTTHQMTVRWVATASVPNLQPVECVLLQASDGFAKLLGSDQDVREVEISDDLEGKLQQLIEGTCGADDIVVFLISHSSLVPKITSNKIRAPGFVGHPHLMMFPTVKFINSGSSEQTPSTGTV